MRKNERAAVVALAWLCLFLFSREAPGEHIFAARYSHPSVPANRHVEISEALRSGTMEFNDSQVSASDCVFLGGALSENNLSLGPIGNSSRSMVTIRVDYADRVLTEEQRRNISCPKIKLAKIEYVSPTGVLVGSTVTEAGVTNDGETVTSRSILTAQLDEAPLLTFSAGHSTEGRGIVIPSRVMGHFVLQIHSLSPGSHTATGSLRAMLVNPDNDYIGPPPGWLHTMVRVFSFLSFLLEKWEQDRQDRAAALDQQVIIIKADNITLNVH